MMAGVVELDKTGRLSSQPWAWPLYTPSLFINAVRFAFVIINIVVINIVIVIMASEHYAHSLSIYGTVGICSHHYCHHHRLHHRHHPHHHHHHHHGLVPTLSVNFPVGFHYHHITMYFFAIKTLSCTQHVMYTSSLFFCPCRNSQLKSLPSNWWTSILGDFGLKILMKKTSELKFWCFRYAGFNMCQ